MTDLFFTNICKGIAIILIVCCHAFGHSFRYFTPLGGIGVTIFLILSGYGLQLSYQKNNLNLFWKKRLIGVYIPFVIVDITYGLLMGGGYTVREFLLNFALIRFKYFSIGWYLNYILLCYFIFWIINRIFCNNNHIKMGVMICAFLSLGIFYFVVQDGSRFEQTFAFPLGVIIAEYGLLDKWKKIWKNRIKSRIIVAFLMGGAFIALIMKQGTVAREDFRVYMTLDLFIKLFAGVAIILVLFDIYYWYHNTLILNSLKKIGECSYAIYLVHGYVLNSWGGLSNVTLNYVFFFVVTVIVSLFFNYVFCGLQSCIKNRFQIIEVEGKKSE